MVLTKVSPNNNDFFLISNFNLTGLFIQIFQMVLIEQRHSNWKPKAPDAVAVVAVATPLQCKETRAAVFVTHSTVLLVVFHYLLITLSLKCIRRQS